MSGLGVIFIQNQVHNKNSKSEYHGYEKNSFAQFVSVITNMHFKTICHYPAAAHYEQQYGAAAKFTGNIMGMGKPD